MTQWPIVRTSLLLLGAAAALYLTVIHYSASSPFGCPQTVEVNCTKVLTSPESVWLGLPVSLYGALWFLTGLLVTCKDCHIPPYLVWIWLSVGVLAVLFLIYQEFWVIQTICLWCTLLHLVILTLFVGDTLWTQAN